MIYNCYRIYDIDILKDIYKYAECVLDISLTMDNMNKQRDTSNPFMSRELKSCKN